MPTVELTAENFDSTITSNDIVIVDFWADPSADDRTNRQVKHRASECLDHTHGCGLDDRPNQCIANGQRGSLEHSQRCRVEYRPSECIDDGSIGGHDDAAIGGA